MSSIYRNGIRYGNTSSIAQNVIYDNTESNLEAENMQEAVDELNSKLPKVLWENPNPSAEFAGQEITLNSDDYDYLEIECAIANSAPSFTVCMRAPKGNSTGCERVASQKISSTVYLVSRNRDFIYVDNTHLTVGNAYLSYSNVNTIRNDYMIPTKIYGGKFA